jgi:hypothetical protein
MLHWVVGLHQWRLEVLLSTPIENVIVGGSLSSSQFCHVLQCFLSVLCLL